MDEASNRRKTQVSCVAFEGRRTRVLCSGPLTLFADFAHLVLSPSCSMMAAEEKERDRTNQVVIPPTKRQLLLYALSVGIPFIGFGMMDNAIMILAGEYIDITLGATFGLSLLASAALGNLISDVAGVGFGFVPLHSPFHSSDWLSVSHCPIAVCAYHCKGA